MKPRTVRAFGGFPRPWLADVFGRIALGLPRPIVTPPGDGGSCWNQRRPMSEHCRVRAERPGWLDAGHEKLNAVASRPTAGVRTSATIKFSQSSWRRTRSGAGAVAPASQANEPASHDTPEGERALPHGASYNAIA